MLHIQALTEHDLEPADEVFRAAFHIGESRIALLQQNLLLQPDGWLLALWDEQPVGLIGAINYGAFAYVGSFSVVPGMQRRGIGQQLLAYLLRWLEDQGCPTVVLDATPDGLPLYKRFGFVEDDTALHWTLHADKQERAQAAVVLSAEVEDSLSRRIEVLRAEDMPALVAFDAAYFGAERGKVLSLFQRRYPERAWLLRDAEGGLHGYLLAQPRILGPWVAESVTDAQLLLAWALTLPFAQPPIVFMPGANEQCRALLEGSGFTPVRTLHHMRRGQPLPSQQRAKLYGLASFTLG